MGVLDRQGVSEETEDAMLEALGGPLSTDAAMN
jgi:hypothetical protein